MECVVLRFDSNLFISACINESMDALARGMTRPKTRGIYDRVLNFCIFQVEVLYLFSACCYILIFFLHRSVTHTFYPSGNLISSFKECCDIIAIINFCNSTKDDIKPLCILYTYGA